MPLAIRERMWLQPDGAPVHYARIVRDYLNEDFGSWRIHALEEMAAEEERLQEEIENPSQQQGEWGPYAGRYKTFEINGPFGWQITNLPDNISPDVFSLIVEDKLLDFLVLETNRYAEMKVIKERQTYVRITRWSPTNREEIIGARHPYVINSSTHEASCPGTNSNCC